MPENTHQSPYEPPLPHVSECILGNLPSHRQVDTDGVPLLDAPSSQDVGDPTSLPQQLCIADLPGLTGLVGFVDDGRLVRVLVSVTVETVVRDVEASFRAARFVEER